MSSPAQDSVGAYAVMAREPVQTIYCSDLEAVRRGIGAGFTETDRFSNMKLLETEDDFVYFDRRSRLIASPVQVYLELATGEKREKETADQVRRLHSEQDFGQGRQEVTIWTS